MQQCEVIIILKYELEVCLSAQWKYIYVIIVHFVD